MMRARSTLDWLQSNNISCRTMHHNGSCRNYTQYCRGILYVEIGQIYIKELVT